MGLQQKSRKFKWVILQVLTLQVLTLPQATSRWVKQRWSYPVWLGIALAMMLMLSGLPGHTVGAVRVRVNRWLSVQYLSGDVTLVRQQSSRPARQNDRLQVPGDGLITGKDSSATLEVDTQIGTIAVAAETTLRIQGLDLSPNDGRITRLQVDRGRVRLQIRPFNNPDSRLEIETPAGISGVRGTEFGINVFPDGKMGVATLDGSVVTSAQGQEVEVPAGFQNVTLPGEPPTQPTPFTNEPRLDYQIERVIRRGVRRVLLTGQVDPTSAVLIQGNPQAIDRDGQFSLLLPAPSRLRLAVTVITPLGQEQTYELQLI
jgi:FecR protein